MIRQAFMLAILGLGCGAIGTQVGRWNWLLFWLGADFLILAVAYLIRSHRVFGKRKDGTLPYWSWALFLPFLAYTCLVWNFARFLIRESACSVVSTDLVVGRRLLNRELHRDITSYIDLTAEFQEPSQIRRLGGYLSFPILDGGAPSPAALVEMVRTLKPGKTFVHCAQGHGRTGLVALAILISSRAVASIDEGLEVLQAARPGIRLNAEQRRCIDDYTQQLARLGGGS